MKVFLLSIIGQTILNVGLFLLILLATRRGSTARKIGWGWIALEYLAFVVAYLCRGLYGQEERTLSLQLFNTYYIALLLYMTYTGAVVTLIFLYGWLRKGYKEGRLWRRRWYGRAVVGMIPISLLLCAWGYHNAMEPQVVRHIIHLPRTASTPDSLRLALVTDIHIGEIITLPQIEKVGKMLRAENPDHLLIGGDVIDYYPDYAFTPEIHAALRSWHHDPSRVYYVLGNHEYYYALEEKKEWLRSLGTLLQDSVASLAPDVYLIGRDDFKNEQRASLHSLIDTLPPHAVRIVLDHQPSTMEEEREEGTHLALHGHTHNGQFVPFSWVVALKFERSYGYYSRGGTQYYISSGLGLAGAPLRVGTRAEIVILDLVFDQ